MRNRFITGLVAAAVLVAALPAGALAQTPTATPIASTPPVQQFQPAPVYNGDGFSLTVYQGSSIEGLKAAGAAAGASGVWVQDSRGVFQLLPTSTAAPAFLQGAFQAAIPTIMSPLAVTLVREPPVQSPGTITLADEGKTIALRVGDTVTVKLGTDTNWTMETPDPKVLRQVVNIAAPPAGTQGTYVAVGAGSTDLRAGGGPNCGPMAPCPAIYRMFGVHIVVYP